MGKKHFDEGIKVNLSVRFNYPVTPYRALRKTRKERSDEIQILSNHAYFFALLFTEIENHLFKKSIRRLDSEKLAQEILNNLYDYNQLLSSTVHLIINELFSLIFEIQVGAYNGAARTLRYILETSVNVCSFQLEKDRPTSKDLFEKYDSIFSNGTDNIMKLQTLLLQQNIWLQFKERLKTYEQVKRPTFKTTLSQLNFKEKSKFPTIFKTLTDLYDELCDYVHLSLEKIKILEKTKKPLMPDYDPEDFDKIYALTVNTMDIIQVLYLKAVSHFLGFSNIRLFLEHFAKITTLTPNYIAQLQKQPYISKFTKNIKWKTCS